MIRALVVDDEPAARKTLRIRIGQEDDFELVGERGSGQEAVEAIRDLAPDVVFLDIRMPDMSGFDVLRALEPDETPYVVFVTAYDEHALRAFEVNALAYLLKPFDDVRFGQVVEHVRRFFEGAGGPGRGAGSLAERIRAVLDSAEPQGPGGSPATQAEAARPARDRLVVRTGARTRLLPIAEIDWIAAEGNYARLHCSGGEAQHLFHESLSELEDRLAPHGFVRIHRSALVNLDRVRELRTENHRDFAVLLEGGQKLRLSRTYRAALEEVIGDRI